MNLQASIAALNAKLPPWLYLPACGGLFLLAFYGLGYAWIPADFYEARDDGVITLSHARNLAEHGFIGVGPSGEKVEGASAPVQLFVHALIYLISLIIGGGGAGYADQAAAQTLVCTFLLGLVFGAFFLAKKAAGLLASAVVAIVLCYHSPFLLWHGSGMENAITHVLFAASLLCLFRFGLSGQINWLAAPLVFLASISRVESAFHIFPLLAVFSAHWLAVHRNLRAVHFSAGVLALWLAFNAWRWLYFGDLLPNTAMAQYISVIDRLSNFMSLDGPYFAESLRLAGDLALAHGALYLLLLLPFAKAISRDRQCRLLLLLCGAVIATSCLHPFFFGEARIDPPRTTTAMAFAVWLALGYAAAALAGAMQPTHINWPRALALCLLLAGLAGFAFKASHASPYYLGWRTGHFEKVRREMLAAAEAQSLPMPTVSNPDLGALSWYKQFNIVDLGALGSRILAAIPEGPLLSEYWFELAAPDLVEVRDWWSCKFHASIFGDARFAARYAPVKAGFFESADFCVGTRLRTGLWTRKDVMQGAASFERAFMDRLHRQPSLALIKRELAECAARAAHQEKPSPYSCAYIARAVYREKPRLLQRFPLADLAALFRHSRTAAFDAFLIEGHVNGAAYKPAILSFFDLLVAAKALPLASAGAEGADIYFDGATLAYRIRQCSRDDAQNPFFLHALQASGQRASLAPDIRIKSHGFRHQNVCIAARRLPPAAASAALITGQWSLRESRYAWQTPLP